jgi:hypothetical protein
VANIHRVLAAVEREGSSLDNPGFAPNAGQKPMAASNARRYECEPCDDDVVCGPQELLLHLAT